MHQLWLRPYQAGVARLAVFLLLIVSSLACSDPPTSEEIRLLQRQGDYKASVEPLRILLEQEPDNPELHLLYGRALSRSGQTQLAVWSLRKAAEDPQWLAPAWREMGLAAMHIGDFPAAIEAAERILEENPDDLRALLMRGESYLGQRAKLEEALADFNRAIELDPDHTGARVSRISALLMMERAEDAEEALAALDLSAAESSVDPTTRAGLCASRGVLLAERDRNDEAQTKLLSCLEQFPSYAIVLEPVMNLFDRAGDPARATEALRNALARVPESQSYRSRLASRLFAGGEREEAEAVLRAGAELADPGVRTTAWTELANFYLDLGDLDGAIESYEEALRLVSDPPQLAILTHADLLARAKYNQRALEVAKQLERDAYRGLIEARVHLNEGRPGRALKRLDTVFTTWPNNAGARYYAARAAEQVGNFERAIEEYRQSIRSDAAQTDAGLRLARLQFGFGRLENAVHSATQHYRANPDDPEGVRVLFMIAKFGTSASLDDMMEQLRSTPHWGLALSLRSEAMAKKVGVDQAISMIEETPGVDFDRPAFLALLRTLVRQLVAADRAPEARERVASALAARPGIAGFHEINGLLLEGLGAPSDEIRAAYQAALDRNGKMPEALAALGRLAAADDRIEEAFDYYDRAFAARPFDPQPAEWAAGLAEKTADLKAAESRWGALAEEHPWHAEAAHALARLRFKRGDSSDQTMMMARRAVIFRAGPEAQRLLIEIHRARGEDEIAQQLQTDLEKRLEPEGVDSGASAEG
ncbi:MAG: tetratricopeptide repeat protein [bacterium]|nr:tetratricopeptide repeat protein [bacterium]